MSIVTDDLVENLIQPPYVNPFYGTHTTSVVPRTDSRKISHAIGATSNV